MTNTDHLDDLSRRTYVNPEILAGNGEPRCRARLPDG